MIALAAFLHQRFAYALLAFAVVLGLWGGYRFFRHHSVGGSWRSSYLLLIGLTGVQGLLGALTLAAGDRPHTLLHVVYGIFAIAFLPGTYFWAARRSPDTEAAVLAASVWIVAIAYGRGITTGGG